jgi:hypothetical protein
VVFVKRQAAREEQTLLSTVQLAAGAASQRLGLLLGGINFVPTPTLYFARISSAGKSGVTLSRRWLPSRLAALAASAAALASSAAWQYFSSSTSARCLSDSLNLASAAPL